MKIKLTNEIESVCGRFILPINTELTVTDTDEQRGMYEASYNDGFFVIPFLCAEAIVEPVPVDEGRPSKIRVIRDLPEFGNLEIKKGDTFEPLRTTDDFYFVSTLSTLIQIPIDAAEVIERRTVLQDWGAANPNDFIVEQEKPTEQNQRPFKIKIIKIMAGMDHSGIDLGDEFYPITWEDDCYGVEVGSYRWVIPKEAAEVIETRPVEESVLDQFQYNDDGRLEPINKELLTEEKRPLNSINVGLDPQIIAGGFGMDEPPSDYHLPNVFSDKEYFDYYMFARAQQAAGLVIDPEIAHVQKKLFVPYRGHKSTKQDVIECIKTLQLWLENNEL